MSIEEVDFKGRPVIKITEDSMKYPFYFGLKKAQLVVKYLKEIELFIEKYKKEEENKGG